MATLPHPTRTGRWGLFAKETLDISSKRSSSLGRDSEAEDN